MNTFYNNIKEKQIFWFFIISIIGFSLRISISQLGHMADMEWWRFISDIYKYNGNFYGTGAHPYAPVWINILYFLDNIPFFIEDNFESLRLKIIIFLSIIDFIIFLILFKLYSLKIASLFLLNPISIYITGFHNQFDNIAVLIGFLAVLSYEKYKNNNGFFICILLLGISLCTKHILFFFPIWLAIKEKKWIRKILITTIPFGILFISFLPFFPDEFGSIVNDVFIYKSFDNGPFWSIFAPQFLGSYIGYKNLFFIALFLMGFFVDKKSILESFYLYLIAVVVFSSAIANQYLVIPVLAMAILWNPYFLFYTLACSIFFIINHDALNIEEIRDLMHWSRNKTRIGYKIIIFFISLGFLQTLIGKKKLNLFVKKIFNWFLEKFKEQFTSK